MSYEPQPAQCPLCKGETSHVLAEKLRRGTGVVYYCAKCDHGFLVSQQQVDAKSYYASDYRKEVSHTAAGTATNARELYDTYSKYQDERLRILDPFLAASSSVLEVGASAGQFLTHIKDRVAHIDAIELDESCAAFIRSELGVDSDSEFLTESRFADKRYDVVCAFQVLEHVEDAEAFVRDIRKAVKPGGHAFIEVPNLRDPLLTVWDVETYRTFYYHSAHLHYFTASSLRRVAESVGFRASEIDVVFTQDYNLLNHLSWVMNGTPQPTCDVGLSPVRLSGPNGEITGWLEEQMRNLNAEYIARLEKAGSTSNLMMVLSVA